MALTNSAEMVFPPQRPEPEPQADPEEIMAARQLLTEYSAIKN